MTRPDDLGLFQSAEWEKLVQALDQVEQRLGQRQSLDLAAYLPPPGSPLRLAWLYELIKTELEIRYRQKRGQPLEHYLQRYPELGSASDLSAGLIYEECLVRHRHGDRPSLAGYQERFPRQFNDLIKLLDEQGWPGSWSPTRTFDEPPGLSRRSGKPPEDRRDTPGGSSRTEYLLPVGGGYRLLERLGSGAFGEVYRAIDPDGDEVAVKWTYRTHNDEAIQRELDSLRTLVKLRHPFLLHTQKFFVHDSRLVLVMDLAEGNLSERLRRCRDEGRTGIPEEELLLWFRQAAEALDYLHSRKVTHRDIKPENLLLLGGQVQVADFGLAREQDDTTIMTSRVGGTPVYMPPETWQNRISFRSDQYSLAASYVELRLGRPLYKARKLAEIRQLHLHGVPDLAPLPPAEEKVLLRALARNTRRRYRSCGAFIQALDRAVRAPEAPPSSRGARAAFLITGLLVVGLVLCWWWLR